MGLKTELAALVGELDHLHQGAAPWSEEIGIPDFVTAENGMQRYFTRKAREGLWRVSAILHRNRANNLVRVELESYKNFVRQAVADMHAAGHFSRLDESDEGNALTKLKSIIEERLASMSNEYTHYFPAWTLGMERSGPFHLGPVIFLNRGDWIDAVDFPQRGKDHYLDRPDANHRWKDLLKDALQKPRDRTPIEGIANLVYGAVAECPALVKVAVRGYELNFSQKLARLVAKAALDAIS